MLRNNGGDLGRDRKVRVDMLCVAVIIFKSCVLQATLDLASVPLAAGFLRSPQDIQSKKCRPIKGQESRHRLRPSGRLQKFGCVQLRRLFLAPDASGSSP